MVYVQQLATTATTTIAVYNVTVTSATQFTVYSKSTASAAAPSSFLFILSPRQQNL